MKAVEIELPKSEYSDQTTSPASSDTLNTIRDRIRTRYKNFRIETGRDLIKARALLPHGAFGPWVKANFSFLSESTVQNYMNAAKLAEEHPEVEKLAPAAAIALAAPNVPQPVKSEVVADLKEGKVPSTKTIKRKIAEAKAQKPAKAKETLSATVTALPVKQADEDAAKPARNDLVERLQAAGLAEARAAFEAAYPGHTILNTRELEAEPTQQAA